MARKNDVYGPVTKISDITRNNEMMRAKIKKTTSRDQITKIYRQSLYLYTLSKTDAWKDNFKGKVIALRKKIRSQFAKTAKAANVRAKEIGTTPDYDPKIN